MIRKQDQLIELIKGLSKSEQRYFKLYAGMQQGDKKFMELYEELKKWDSYDAKILKKGLKVSARNLVDCKRYLQQVLLDSLRLFHQDGVTTIKLQNQWQEARLLQARKLHQMAFELNEKVLKKATKFEIFSVMQLCLRDKYSLLLLLDRTDETKAVITLMNLLMEQMVELQQLMTNINAFTEVVRGMQARTQLRLIAESLLFKRKVESLKSNSAKLLWHDMKQYYYNYAERNVEAAIHHNLARLKIFESHPHMIDTWPHAYLTAMSYLVNFYGDIERYDEALRYAQLLEYESDGHRKDIPLNRAAGMNLTAQIGQLYLLCYTERFQEALQVGAVVNSRKKELNLDLLIFSLHHYALAFYHAGKYDKAQKVCEEIQGLNPEIMPQVQLSCKILLAMIHYANGNIRLLPYTINSAVSWSKRHKVKAPGTAEILGFIKRLPGLSSQKEKMAFFKEMRTAFREFKFQEYDRLLCINHWINMNTGHA